MIIHSEQLLCSKAKCQITDLISANVEDLELTARPAGGSQHVIV